MANRPIFLSTQDINSLVKEIPVEFVWHPGLSISQKQKSILSLHAAAEAELGSTKILEVSSKSENEFGKKLSAFSLRFRLAGGKECSVECAFQGSKVFANGGPYDELYGIDSRAAKRDDRMRSSGQLLSFSLEGNSWPTVPRTCFYDWLYMKALDQDGDLRDAVFDFRAFSDIEFNPKKSINCQAQAAARYVALRSQGLLGEALRDREYFISLYGETSTTQSQGSLFD